MEGDKYSSHFQIQVFNCHLNVAEMRIAQIKFYQQLGFAIKEVTVIIEAPNAVIKTALERQVQKLIEEKAEMDELIEKANQMITKLSKEISN